MNLEIREDKRGRKELGLVTKEKDRPRELLTELGTIHFSRDYYFNKTEGSYMSLLDAAIGIRPYERIGDSVSAELVSRAADVSYAKSSEFVTGGNVSRQTVRNHILKLNVPESPPAEEKKTVSALHIFADEDHVAMQKPNKQRGKRNKIVPLVTVTEGIKPESERRNRTVNPKHFVDEKFDTNNLWKSVEGYIAMAYDTDSEEEKKRDELKEYAVYILGNWKAITERKTDGMTGSCTEAQVSNVLSTRFSRNPMGWSEEALGKLTATRVFMKNGEVLTADHFKPENEDRQKYCEYADQIIKESIAGAIDWSLFDVERTNFDLASGTQIKIQGMGKMRNTLFN